MDIDKIDFLPQELKKILISSGVFSLKDFQIEGIKVGLTGKNVLVVAPTGAGKTLIGEILGILKIVNGHKKVLYLVPYKALAEELYVSFKSKYPFIKFEIGTGDYLDKPNEMLGRDGDFLIVTYEKADSIIRNPPSWFSKLGLVIVDEVHLISDYERGPIVDSVLTHCLKKNIQIVALSATIPNPNDLSEWLKAKLVISFKRPVKLLEGIYFQKNRKIYFYDPQPDVSEEIFIDSTHHLEGDPEDRSVSLDYIFMSEEGKDIKGEVKVIRMGEVKRVERRKCRDDIIDNLIRIFYDNDCDECFYCIEINRSSSGKRGFMGAIIDLVNDLFQNMRELGVRWQILIFRKSRRLAQITAKNVAEYMKKSKLNQLFPEAQEIAKILLSEVDEPTPITEELARVLEHGVAFHHAGLSHKERSVIEKAFRNRKIGVIVATPTLAAGINLPARRVVIEHKFYWGGEEEISVASYKQRSGRAGRPGLDTVGEAILVAKDEDELIYLFNKYVFGELERIESKLGVNLPALRDQTLALIVSSNYLTETDIQDFFKDTFYYFTFKKYFRRRDRDFLVNVKNVIEDLIKWGFVERRGELLVRTDLGALISKMYLDPLTAHDLIEFLYKKKKPSSIDVLSAILSTPDLSNYRIRALALVKKSSSILKKIDLINQNTKRMLKESKYEIMNVLEYLSLGYQLFLSIDEEKEISVFFLLVLILLWMEGVPIKEILDGLSPNFGTGDFLEMLRSVSRLLYCTIEISKKLNLDKKTIREFSILREQVEKGVPREMLELTKIPLIGRVRAQILYKHGFKNLKNIANATVRQLSRLPNIGEKIAKEAIKFAREKTRV